MTKKLLLLLVLLLTATMSIWAQTTHVVTQTTVDNIFNGDGYTLGDAVKAGDVLDFQGEIDLQHSLIVNKQVTIKSTTTDAVVKLNTPTNVKPDEYSATVMYPQSFVINKAGSGTTVQDIRIENTETWLYNTSNVTFTGVTMWVEEARIGSGVGQVSIRYSDHVTFDGCTVYSKNNGGNSGCLLTGSHDCTFKDTRFEGVGNAGNPLYLGCPFSTDDMPAGYTMNADNISVLNCTLTKDVASATCMFAIAGLRHHIEGCTIVKMRTSSAFGATVPNSASEGHTILNNTITDGSLNVLNYCTAEGNTVTGSVTIYQGATATGNTITGNVTVSGIGATVKDNTITGNVSLSKNDITFTGNKVQGKLTHSQKTATITGNTIISTEEYAVYLTSTAADANNTVTNNNLKAAAKTGDEAVSSKSTSNTIKDNGDANKYTAKLKEGVQDADKWTIAPAEATTDGVYRNTTITATYSGTKKVLGMKVAKKAANVHSITIAVDPSTNDPKATAPAMTIEFKTGETWADVAARYDWLDTYETYTVFYKDDILRLRGDVHNANGGVKPNQTIDPNGSYHWGM